jgi:hypothetical protein
MLRPPQRAWISRAAWVGMVLFALALAAVWSGMMALWFAIAARD